MRKVLSLALLATLVAVGCSDDPSSGSTGDDVATDTAPADTGADPGAPDPGEADPGQADPGQADTGPTCEHACLDEFGKSKKQLCPAPISEWNCIEGCCVPVFKCATDADCLAQGFDEGHCTDERFDCRCDTGSGICHPWYCAADADCGAGDICVSGVCEADPGAADLALRIATRTTVLTEGATTQILVEGYDPANVDVVRPVEVTWSSSDDAVVAVDAAGLATGGATEGEAMITAAATADATKTASILLRNVLVDGAATLTVIAVEERTTLGVAGRYALVSGDDGSVLEAGDIPATGVITYSAALPAAGVDVHVMPTGHDWVSYLRHAGGVLLAPVAPIFWGEVELDKDNNVVADATTLVGSNIISGAPDYSFYDKTGEFEVTLNSFELTNSLLDFNLVALLGTDAKRYFDPDFALSGLINVDEIAQIPGGLTFGLEGPAIPSFWLAAPKGTHTLWTLGGRAEMGEVSEYIGDILEAVNGDTLDIGRVVTAIIPVFRNFYSGITPELTFVGDGAQTVTTVAPVLKSPMALHSEVLVPQMPSVGADVGWAEVAILLGGALMADGSFVPLGMSAGSDTRDAEQDPPDGVADADDGTPAHDPFDLGHAMMHSGVGGPHARYAAAVVALSVNPGGGSARRDAGSALLHRSPLAASPDAAPDLGEFLPFPLTSSYDETTRVLTVEALAEADAQRMLFKGKRGVNWSIWLNGETSYTVPVPAAWFGDDPEMADRSTNTELMLVNSFDFADGETLEALAAPGGRTLDLLLLVTDRVSFFDIRP